MIKSKNITICPIANIVPSPVNRNIHPERQLAVLKRIIELQGFRDPLIVSNRSGHLVSGHARLEVAKQLGYKELPVIYQDFDSEEQEYKHLIAANEIARYAEFDKDGFLDDIKALDLELESLDFEEFGLLNFEIPEIEKLPPQGDPDDCPEPPKEPKTVKGDVYELGNHRIMCGDSTMIDDVEKLMNGEKAYALYTDPPYGMNLDTDYSKMNGKGNKYKKIIGDDNPFDANEVLPFFEYCKEIFMWGADYYIETTCRTHENLGSWIVWDKYPTDENGKRFGSAFELCWSKQKHKREICRVKSINVNHQTVKEKEDHPTQKPIALSEWFFERWIPENSLVADLFLGSGSTLIACEKTNRKCYGMEIDPHYCDVIVSRYVKYTGNNKIKLNGQDIEWSVE